MDTHLESVKAMTVDEVTTMMLLTDDDKFMTQYLDEKAISGIHQDMEKLMMDWYSEKKEHMPQDVWMRKRAALTMKALEGVEHDGVDTGPDHQHEREPDPG